MFPKTILDVPQNETNRADPQNDGTDPRGTQIDPEQIQVLTPEEIKRELDVCEAAGFIKRYRPGANNFYFTPMGHALLNSPDPKGRDWMTRMLAAAVEIPPRTDMS